MNTEITASSPDAIGDGIRLHEKVRKWIISDLIGRKLLPGEVYSTEGELVERLRVSRNTIRKAMDSLVKDNYFERRRRVGLVISEKSAKLFTINTDNRPNSKKTTTPPGRLMVILPEWDDSTEGFYAGRILHAMTSPNRNFNWTIEIRHPQSIIDIPNGDNTVILAFDPKAVMLDRLSELAAKGVRIVSDQPSKKLPYAVNISFDIRTAVRDATIHFLKQGHQHVGIINHDTQHSDYRQAMHGFIEAHQELQTLIHPDGIIQLWLDNICTPTPNVTEITAWICTFAKSVDYVADSCRTHNLAIPENVQIIGIDDPGDVVLASLGRKISVTSQSPEAAADMILKVLEDRSTYRPGNVVMIPATRVDRGTTLQIHHIINKVLQMTVSSYFNINAVWGHSPYAQSDFPTLKSLLEHMDYLQIDRAVAWHREAVDYNPHMGNIRTFKEIESSPEARHRLIPAIIITPASAYEFGEIENIRNILKTGRTKVVRICPKTSRFSMYQLQRILEHIAEFSPCVLWDIHSECNGPNEIHELQELAKNFPLINFVVTSVMWNNFGDILDLMWRHNNVYVDTSWLHVRNALELLVDEFGAKRILFGIGWKSHYGASIAGLNFANINNQDRELIAHGNAERLLCLPTTEKTLYNEISNEKKTLWEKFRNGETLHDINIIDAHAHSGPHARCWYLRENSLTDYIDALESQMERTGVKKMIITPESALFGNPVQGALKEESSFKGHEKFCGYIPFNPYYAENIEKHFNSLFKSGFYVGFKILASYWGISIDDSRFNAAWQYADRFALPILIHTWGGAVDSPARLSGIAAKYPNAIFIIGHAGGNDTGRCEAENLVLSCKNIMLEFCGSFCSHKPWHDTIRKVGCDKIIFGSDTGCHSQAWELGRLLSTPVPEDAFKPILAGNIEYILKKSKKDF